MSGARKKVWFLVDQQGYGQRKLRSSRTDKAGPRETHILKTAHIEDAVTSMFILRRTGVKQRRIQRLAQLGLLSYAQEKGGKGKAFLYFVGEVEMAWNEFPFRGVQDMVQHSHSFWQAKNDSKQWLTLAEAHDLCRDQVRSLHRLFQWVQNGLLSAEQNGIILTTIDWLNQALKAQGLEEVSLSV